MPDFASISASIDAIAAGSLIVVVDDDSETATGALAGAAQFMDTEKLVWLSRRVTGLIGVPMSVDRADELELDLMVAEDEATGRGAFTVSVDLVDGNTTGSSPADQARTIAALARAEVAADDFARPGHVFPLRAREGGVLQPELAQHPELAELARHRARDGRVGEGGAVDEGAEPAELRRERAAEARRVHEDALQPAELAQLLTLPGLEAALASHPELMHLRVPVGHGRRAVWSVVHEAVHLCPTSRGAPGGSALARMVEEAAVATLRERLLPRASFSKKQWSSAAKRRCIECVETGAEAPRPAEIGETVETPFEDIEPFRVAGFDARTS